MPEPVDILFINPGDRDRMYGALAGSLSGCEPPIWTALTAAFLREKGHSARIMDADAAGWSPERAADAAARDLAPRLIGVAAAGANPSASSTPKMDAVIRLCRALRERLPGVPVIVYGIHPSALPERTLEETGAEFVCRGETFLALDALLAALKAGRGPEGIRGIWTHRGGAGWAELLKDLDGLPAPAWDLLPMEKYRAHNWHCFDRLDQRQPYGVIYTSLGCPFGCTYCNVSALYDGRPGIRFRSPARVAQDVDLLATKYGVRNIKILDELFVLKESAVLELLDLLIARGYGLNIWAYARVDTVNERMLSKMKQAGVNWLAYGIESGSQEVRRGVAKGKLSQDSIRRAVSMTHEAGIHVVGNFIFGLPEDDRLSLQQTYDLAAELNCEYANFYVAMAYPGSRLYEDSLRDRAPLPEHWTGYSQFSEETLPLPTRHLSAGEVLRFRDSAFDRYYRRPEYRDMVLRKFGPETLKHIEGMLQHKLRRKHAAPQEAS
ncbi:MAG: radical SAM protein [Elusimicrobia bacterium]|nr:radical SAM protein [Elusimicrobiota bacterium]